MLISAENGDVDTVRSMLADIHDPMDRAALVNVHDNDGYSPLHRASYGGHLETAKVRPYAVQYIRAFLSFAYSPVCL